MQEAMDPECESTRHNHVGMITEAEHDQVQQQPSRQPILGLRSQDHPSEYHIQRFGFVVSGN